MALLGKVPLQAGAAILNMLCFMTIEQLLFVRLDSALQ